MKRSFEINLGGRIFSIDEDAYELLNGYIESLKSSFSKRDGGDEIIADIEARLGELCETRMREGRARIVDFAMVDEFITRMGRPENLAGDIADEAPVSDGGSDGAPHSDDAKREPWRDAMLLGRKLFRNTRDGILGGVCSGIATYLGCNVWLLRIVAILLFLFLIGIVAPIIYLVAWVAIPQAASITDFMRMHEVRPVGGERLEEAWQREYERASAQIMNGVGGDNKGCLVGCLFITIAIIALPFIIIYVALSMIPSGSGLFENLFFNGFADHPNVDITMGPVWNMWTYLFPIMILIPIFLIIHHILKRKGKVQPLKRWIKILLVALWCVVTFIFLVSDNKSINTPFFKYSKRVTINGKQVDNIDNFFEKLKLKKGHTIIERRSSGEAIPLDSISLDELKQVFKNPEEFDRKESNRFSRILWSYIKLAHGDSPIPLVCDVVQLDDKVKWRFVARDEWVDYVKNPSSAGVLEIEGIISSDDYLSAQMVCIVDTVQKRIWVPLAACKEIAGVNTANNSLAGWSVEFGRDDFVFSSGVSELMLTLTVFEENDTEIPQLVIHGWKQGDADVSTKVLNHTLGRQGVWN